ncbi:phage tail tape measure protein [Bacillus cereus]|uniref:phage tail tape measure protein n=1 Tax=Bacillus cereus TaxID=1396 RepID=UPI000BF7DBAA|nr:phage tail tape measure protein [Bacillus cereus]PFC54105.1 phage tail tape measure protein [Bacillus cereus]PFJ93976.1 phage tail tape measure protein [Bacillus cereus]PFK49316.1 phage tail tape measure protein [Bacillus cereus]PGO70830.1 phage tail tape measure protein [Bacillus cereus]
MSASAGEVRARLVLDNAQFRAGVAQSRSDMQNLDRGSQSTSKGMSALGKASAIAGVAMVGAIGASIKSAMHFEQSMAKVKAISGATDNEFAQLTNTAKHLGATTQFSASQAAEGLSFLSMAGFKAQDSMDALPAVLNLAAVGGIELGKSADIASNIMTGFGLSAKDTDKAVDVLAKTMTTANTDLDQLGMAMKYVAPVAKSLGWGIEDSATAIAKMSDAGIQGSQAGTSLRAALLSLANPTGQTEKAFKKLGISVVDTNGQFKPLPELIGHISSKMDGMTDAQKTVTAAQLVGTEASAGFLALLDQGQDSLQKYKNELELSGGTAERVARIQQETLNGAWLQTKSAMEGVAIAIGESLLPAFTSFANGATNMVGILGKLDPQLVGFGLTAGAVTAGTALLAVGIVKVVNAMKTLSYAIVTNPATAWIAGISLAVGVLTSAMMHGKSEAEQYKAVSMDTYKEIGEQARTVDDLATQFDTMRGKINLSNDELLRYRDAMKEVERVENPEKKKALVDEMDRLAKASGVSHEELKKFLGVNDEIIAKAPSTAQAYSKNGEALALNADAAKELVSALKEKQKLELDQQLNQSYKNQAKDLKDYAQNVKEGNEKIANRKNLVKDVETQQKKVNELETKYNEAKDKGQKGTAHMLKKELSHEEAILSKKKEKIDTNELAISQHCTEIQSIVDKRKEAENIVRTRVAEAMQATKISYEVGKEAEAIDKALEGHNKTIASYEKKQANQQKITEKQQEEYDNAVKNKGVLEETKNSIGEMRAKHEQNTAEYDKQIEKAGKLNDKTKEPVDKDVNLKTEEAEVKNKKVEGEIEKQSDKKMGVDDTKAQEGIKKTEKDIEKQKDKKVGADTKKADGEVDKLDKKAVAEKIKKIFGNTTSAKLLIDLLDKQATAEKTKKVKADKSQADREIADIDRKALAEKVKKILGDGKMADAVIKVLDSHAEKKKTKPIDADTSNADSKHETLMGKIVKTATKRISLEWLGDLNPLKYFHSGGTVGASPSNRSTRPKYHNGGNPRGLVGKGAKFDEVDARLLKNEMVLTQAQQANLFNFIRTANRPSVGVVAPSKGGGQVGNTMMTVNVNVAEMNVRDDQDLPKLAKEISQEMARMERQKQRARGQW